MAITNVSEELTGVKLFQCKSMLTATTAVTSMVQYNFVLQDCNYDINTALVWWSERCSCFHYMIDGDYRGIYTKGSFANMRPMFIIRDDADKAFLYRCVQSQFREYLNERYAAELKYLESYDLTAEAHILGGFIEWGNHITLKKTIPRVTEIRCGDGGCAIEQPEPIAAAWKTLIKSILKEAQYDK